MGAVSKSRELHSWTTLLSPECSGTSFCYIWKVGHELNANRQEIWCECVNWSTLAAEGSRAVLYIVTRTYCVVYVHRLAFGRPLLITVVRCRTGDRWYTCRSSNTELDISGT